MPDQSSLARPSRFQRILPGLTLMLLAPLVAEVLSGATRIQAMFVFPIEFIIWGGGAVLIRAAVRRWQLGWCNMLLLAVALAIAEECLIQQTSLAPLVIKIRGEEYARAFNFNYVYFLWAVAYESLFVVFLPVALTELIFPRRRHESWVSTTGATIIALLFVPASFAAWFTWTQIARTKVFHLDAYSPPHFQIALAAAAIAGLIALALGPARNWLARPVAAIRPPHPIALFMLGCIVATILFALMLLAFGIAPSFPPLAAVAIQLALIALLVAVVPRFYAHPAWTTSHQVGIVFGAIIGNMAITFVSSWYDSPLDFYGKLILDAIALVLMIWLALRLHSSERAAAGLTSVRAAN
jgi:hypothetical protein